MIDAGWRTFVDGLPGALSSTARELPFRLGLTEHRAGGFEDFVVLAPNRDLPSFAAEDPITPGSSLLSEKTLARFREAHALGAVFGLLSDRLDDGQVRADRELVELRPLVLRGWVDRLTAAVGDGERARNAIARALRALRRGTAAERAALARGQLSLPDYRAQTCQKLGWFGVSARCLLESIGHLERAAQLDRSYDRFSLALQCLDDAVDAEDDQRGRGASFPALLGVSPGGLARAAPLLVRDAAAIAGGGGFHRLADWLGGFGSLIERWPAPGDALRNQLAAFVVAEGVGGA